MHDLWFGLLGWLMEDKFLLKMSDQSRFYFLFRVAICLVPHLFNLLSEHHKKHIHVVGFSAFNFWGYYLEQLIKGLINNILLSWSCTLRFSYNLLKHVVFSRLGGFLRSCQPSSSSIFSAARLAVVVNSLQS